MKNLLILTSTLLALGLAGCAETTETGEPGVGTVRAEASAPSPDLYCCCTDPEHKTGCKWQVSNPCNPRSNEVSDTSACGTPPYLTVDDPALGTLSGEPTPSVDDATSRPLSDDFVLTVSGDTPSAPTDAPGWPDGTPQNGP